MPWLSWMSSPFLRQTAAARGMDAFGPLKADHSAYCPGDLTHAEKEEQCVSVQEHAWGTDGLAKLEAIKAKVDPQGLFQCQKCVGFKGPVRDQ